MARVVGRSEATKRNTRGTRMLEVAVEQLKREAQEAKHAAQAYKSPPAKAAPARQGAAQTQAEEPA